MKRAASPPLRAKGATTETYGYNYLNVLSSYTNSQTGANCQYDYYPSGERYAKINLRTARVWLAPTP